MDGMVCSIPELHGFFWIFGNCFSKIDTVLFIAIRTIRQLVLVARRKLPSWNSRSSRSLSFLFLVPSGKMQTEIPDLISSIPDRMVFSPFLYLSGQGRDSGDNASSLKAEVSSPSQLWQYSRSAVGSGCRWEEYQKLRWLPIYRTASSVGTSSSPITVTSTPVSHRIKRKTDWIRCRELMSFCRGWIYW